MFSTLSETYRTLSDLPHATRGDPEDAASDGDDHLPDALRYLLINLGTGPSWPETDPPPDDHASHAEALEPRGPFAYRHDDRDGLDGERDPRQGTTQRPPWA